MNIECGVDLDMLAEMMVTHTVPQEKGKAFLSEKMQAELKDRQQSRFPYVIVPGAISALNVNDKDGNGVYRIVVYKEQAEDVIKACRKL